VLISLERLRAAPIGEKLVLVDSFLFFAAVSNRTTSFLQPFRLGIAMLWSGIQAVRTYHNLHQPRYSSFADNKKRSRLQSSPCRPLA